MKFLLTMMFTFILMLPTFSFADVNLNGYIEQPYVMTAQLFTDERPANCDESAAKAVDLRTYKAYMPAKPIPRRVTISYSSGFANGGCSACHNDSDVPMKIPI